MEMSSTSTVRRVKPARWRRLEASRGSKRRRGILQGVSDQLRQAGLECEGDYEPAMGDILGLTPPLLSISANCNAVLQIRTVFFSCVVMAIIGYGSLPQLE